MKLAHIIITSIGVLIISLTSIGMEKEDPESTVDMKNLGLNFSNLNSDQHFLNLTNILDDMLKLTRRSGPNGGRSAYEGSSATYIVDNVPITQEQLNAELMLAIQRKDHLLARLCLGKGADPNAPSNDSTKRLVLYPLIEAAGYGSLEIVALLLAYHAKVDIKEEVASFQAIHFAAMSGHASIVELLIEHGADPDAQMGLDSYLLSGGRPIHCAAISGRAESSEVIEVLIRNGANIHATVEMGIQAILLVMVTGNEDCQLKMAQCLLDNGANIFATDISGGHPIHLAAGKGWLKLAELFWHYGADLNVRDYDGTRPIDIAQKNGHHTLVNWINQKNGSSMACESHSKLPQQATGEEREHEKLEQPVIKIPETLAQAIKGNDIARAQWFLDQGTSVHDMLKSCKEFDFQYLLPIHAAAMCGNIEIAQLFIRYGADINMRVSGDSFSAAKKDTGVMPIHCAVIGGHLAFAKWLVSLGANIHATATMNLNGMPGQYEYGIPHESKGMQLIHIAAANGKQDFVEWLVNEHAVNVNAINKAENRAIHFATVNNHRELIKWLIAHKADPKAKNKKGKRPFHLAKACHHENLIELYKKYETGFFAKLLGK